MRTEIQLSESLIAMIDYRFKLSNQSDAATCASSEDRVLTRTNGCVTIAALMGHRLIRKTFVVSERARLYRI